MARQMPQSERSIAELTARIRDRLFAISFERPQLLAQSVTDSILEILDVEAATFYLNVPELDACKLKAASGFDYGKYENIILRNPSYVSEAIRREESIVAELPLDPTLFHDHSLLDGTEISHLICVPIPSTDDRVGYPKWLGALCVYPSQRNRLSDIRDVTETIVQWLGLLYASSIDQTFMELRRRVVVETAFEDRLSTVCQGTLDILEDVLGFKFGAIWLLDPRREQLILRARTPLGRLTESPVETSDLRDREEFLSFAYHGSAPIYASRDSSDPRSDDRDLSAMSLEVLNPHSVTNVMLAPIRSAKEVTLGNHKRTGLGVLIVGDNFSDLADRRFLHPVTWDDQLIVNFVAEMAAVLLFQALRTVDHEADYERRIHGLKAGLGSVRSHLDALERRENISELVDSRHRYYLPNCKVWVEEMLNQVAAFDWADRSRIDLDSVRLYADVIAKSTVNARNMARASGFSTLVVHGEDSLASNPRRLPPVLADASALLTVFRNLFENTVKYREDSTPEVQLSVVSHYSNGLRFVEITYEDNGIGVPARIRDRIFDEGYRSSLAKQIHGGGHGIGLYQSRVLMDAMGGSIDCVEPGPLGGARFVLILQAE